MQLFLVISVLYLNQLSLSQLKGLLEGYTDG